MLILCCSRKNPKSWKLARKEESHPHNSSCPGSIKSHEISLRRSFCTLYFFVCGHMEQVMYGRSKSQVSGANKFTKNGLNGVPVARLGLILGEDGATASRKLLRYLPGPKNHSTNQTYIKNSRYTALAADMLTSLG